jgi:hypothetical protein
MHEATQDHSVVTPAFPNTKKQPSVYSSPQAAPRSLDFGNEFIPVESDLPFEKRSGHRRHTGDHNPSSYERTTEMRGASTSAKMFLSSNWMSAHSFHESDVKLLAPGSRDERVALVRFNQQDGQSVEGVAPVTNAIPSEDEFILLCQGLFQPRLYKPTYELFTPTTLTSKGLPCLEYSAVFANSTHAARLARGQQQQRRWRSSGVPNSPAVAGGSPGTPSSRRDVRVSETPPSASPSKGRNIFMSRKTESAGTSSRLAARAGGLQVAVARGLPVGSAFPFPASIAGVRGQVLLCSAMRAKYMRHQASAASSSAELTGLTSPVAGASVGRPSASAPSVSSADRGSVRTRALTAGSRPLAQGRGLADLPASADISPSLVAPPVNTAPLQDGEIESADMIRYYAVLLSCGDGDCEIKLFNSFSSGFSSMSPEASAIPESSLRALIHCRKSSLVCCLII